MKFTILLSSTLVSHKWHTQIVMNASRKTPQNALKQPISSSTQYFTLISCFSGKWLKLLSRMSYQRRLQEEVVRVVSSMQIAGLGTRGTGTCGTGTAGLGHALQGQRDWDMQNWDSFCDSFAWKRCMCKCSGYTDPERWWAGRRVFFPGAKLPF